MKHIIYQQKDGKILTSRGQLNMNYIKVLRNARKSYFENNNNFSPLLFTPVIGSFRFLIKKPG